MMHSFKSFLFVSGLLAVVACGEDAKTPAPSLDCEGADCPADDDGNSTPPDSDGDETGSIDAGKGALDAGKTPPKSDASTASDAGVKSDAGKPADTAVGIDAAVGDAGATSDAASKADASKTDAGESDAGKVDAGHWVDDAGDEPAADASEPVADGGGEGDGGSTPTGSCAGDTPHGCYTPVSENPDTCPTQTPEVNRGGLLPPIGNFTGCEDGAVDLGTSCDYVGPDGDANCLCAVGGRWLCIYP